MAFLRHGYPPKNKTMRKILLFLFLSLVFLPVVAQTSLPQKDGERMRYNIEIDFGRAYVSGICLLLNDGGDMVKGSIVNEFGVSFMDFSYSQKKRRVRLHSVAGPLDRWYVRLALRRDLRGLMQAMQKGDSTYTAGKRVYKVVAGLCSPQSSCEGVSTPLVSTTLPTT